MPFVQSADAISSSINYAVSPSGKTVEIISERFFIDSGNVLRTKASLSMALYIHVRNFDDGPVTQSLDRKEPIPLQYGSVIFVSTGKDRPIFLTASLDLSGLLPEERFECVKEFCFLAKVPGFTAIVDRDRPVPGMQDTITTTKTRFDRLKELFK